MNLSPTLFALLASSATVLAQAPQAQRVAGFDVIPLVWQQDIDQGDAIVAYDELAGEGTLLFAHVSIDEEVAGTLVAAGVAATLPFLASPITENWKMWDPEFASSGYTFIGDHPMVLPRRMADHIADYQAASNELDFGTVNTTSSWIERETHPWMVGAPTDPADERNAWTNSAWTWYDAPDKHSFNSAQLGQNALMLSAHEHVQEYNLQPISTPAINALNQLMSAKLGWIVFVQAAHVSTNGGEVQVRISRHSRIRRRSLLNLDQDWPYGPPRYVPKPSNSAINVYLAPRGDNLHLEFPVDVGTLTNPTTLRAYVPTTTGLVLVDQIANPTAGEGVDERVVKPRVGIFPCPANAINGILYIEQVSNPGQRFSPDGHYGHAAMISAYDIPPGPIIPPMLPAPPPTPAGGGGPQ